MKNNTHQVDLRAVIQVLHWSAFKNIQGGNSLQIRLSEKLFKGQEHLTLWTFTFILSLDVPSSMYLHAHSHSY